MNARTADPNGAWLPRAHADPDVPLRLFCLPPAGAGTAFYRPWTVHPGTPFSVHPILLPGRESRLRESPRTDLRTLVGDLARAVETHLDRPYALFGHSMGALLAYETARALQSSAPPAALFLSGRRGPATAALRPPISDRDDRGFVDGVAALGGIPGEILERPDMVEMILPALRADFRLNERYRPLNGPALTCPATLYAGRDDPEAPPKAVLGWGREIDGDYTLRVFAGGHFYFSPDPGRVLTAIADDLRRAGALK
ncbi:alpha/beta fold hydrolase [Glycomyces halotolerans]